MKIAEKYQRFIAWVLQVDKALQWMSRNLGKQEKKLKTPLMIKIRLTAWNHLTQTPWHTFRNWRLRLALIKMKKERRSD